jgi:hypothetical protein
MTTTRRNRMPATDDPYAREVSVPRPRSRRPRGAQAVERSLQRALRDPAALPDAAAGLVPLTGDAVRAFLRESWVRPSYEQLWRDLARHAPRSVRGYCLELAADCRWGGR